jgi:hypothetical protein
VITFFHDLDPGASPSPYHCEYQEELVEPTQWRRRADRVSFLSL